MNPSLQKELYFLVESHLSLIYEDNASKALAKKLIHIMALDEDCLKPGLHENSWNQSDVFMITYGDSLRNDDEEPLHTLHHFMDERLKGTINGIHILPFFPYSSDDGFSVIDYTQVNDSLGDWSHIEKIGADYNLMSDLVVNHCSSRSRWFDNYKQRKSPGIDYFIEADPETDLSQVVRPRTSPLLREVETLDGKRHVWCTFSHDQVDLNFANTNVLCEMVNIIKLYLDRGVRTFRLDAVAFLWKEIGTESINHPKTHELVRLFRTLIEHHSPNAIIITETNIPNHENLSYFGNANEAHAVYNFSLPPLLLHALLTGNGTHLKKWQMSMPPAQMGTFYLNFIASHDGIGLRPAEGLLSETDIDEMVNALQGFGARVSWRATEGGRSKPYEINVTLFDALEGTINGPDKWQIERFLCAHAIMLSLEGVPAIYIHSLLGTNNYTEGVQLTNHNRTINRYKWNINEISEKLDDGYSHHSTVFTKMKALISVRIKQPAFHPNATQFTLHLGDDIFAFWRQSLKREQSIFCIHNISSNTIAIPLSSINLISLDEWTDLNSGKIFTNLHDDVQLPPYGFVWLTNKPL
ncbi:alpha-amylase family glycosyl hydrolase [Teredinibacter purpureus]|uniref:alpha-amylase family glycosyl hydrolase n=1 Tax=Teredinibacter purpureus TaxID=2731756 RepID=UPI0005F801A6|nr:alpha-amylase family glycosyl hydrolase [Teredinibacter purpureus]